MKGWFIQSFILLKKTFLRLSQDKSFKHGAAISYYTLFSLPAILIIIVNLTGAVLGRTQVQSEIQIQIEKLMGPDTATEVIQMINGLNQDRNTWWATLLGIATLVFGGTGVFYTLQDSINTIWRIPNQLEQKGNFLKLLIDRFISLAMILTLGFILTVAMVLETAIVAIKSLIEVLEGRFMESIQLNFPKLAAFIEEFDLIFAIAYSLDTVFGLAVISWVFAMLFRFLPSSRIPWRDAWLGAFVTAVFFSIGKALIGWYIGNSNLSSTYGAAGSVVLILVWVFYSSQILLFGAEFIFVYSEYKGRSIKPAPFIQRILDRPWQRFRLWFRRWQRKQRKRHKPPSVSQHSKEQDLTSK